jgi:hypothetical protein
MILPYEEVGVAKIIRITKRDFNGVNITGDIMYFRHLGSVRKPCGYVMLIRASELSLRSN